MKTIHIVGAGGVAGIGMTRCLKDDYDVQGHDESQWAELCEECIHERDGVNLWNADLIIPVPDKAVDSRYGTSDLSFTPHWTQVKLCQDKAKCAGVLGDLAPKIYWVRDTHGAGGSGAQMASEYLPGRNFSCELAYNKGEFIGYFIKERLSYSVKGKDLPEDKKGSSAVSVCRQNDRILTLAKSAIHIISEYTKTKPNGFYGVDFKENKDNEPKITEINAGRLLTASYVYFYETGYNLALAGVKSYFNEKYELGKYPEGWGVIRQTDSKPKLFGPEITKEWL